MIFYTTGENYPQRHALLEKISSRTELLDYYLLTEPHTLLHVGLLSRFLTEQKLNHQRCLSLGIDLVKECLLSEKNGLELTVIDIDHPFIQLCNQFVAGKYSTQYQYCDFQSPNFFEVLRDRKPRILLLSQMDYLMTDATVQSVVQAAHAEGINEIVMLTPSLYSFVTARNPLVNFRNSIDYCIDWLSSRASRRHRHYGAPTYRRRFSRLNALIRPRFELVRKQVYQYPSGRMHLLHYRRA